MQAPRVSTAIINFSRTLFWHADCSNVSCKIQPAPIRIQAGGGGLDRPRKNGWDNDVRLIFDEESFYIPFRLT